MGYACCIVASIINDEIVTRIEKRGCLYVDSFIYLKGRETLGSKQGGWSLHDYFLNQLKVVTDAADLA
jgi:hypothetical protein